MIFCPSIDGCSPSGRSSSGSTGSPKALNRSTTKSWTALCRTMQAMSCRSLLRHESSSGPRCQSNGILHSITGVGVSQTHCAFVSVAAKWRIASRLRAVSSRLTKVPRAALPWRRASLVPTMHKIQSGLLCTTPTKRLISWLVVSPDTAALITVTLSCPRRRANASRRISSQEWLSSVMLSPTPTTVAPGCSGRSSTCTQNSASARSSSAAARTRAAWPSPMRRYSPRSRPNRAARRLSCIPGMSPYTFAGWMNCK